MLHDRSRPSATVDAKDSLPSGAGLFVAVPLALTLWMGIALLIF